MKQSILFEQGKLYVVELPNYNYGKYSHSETKNFDEATDKAFANKVEVKNPAVLDNLSFRIAIVNLKDGDTFDLPDGIEVAIQLCDKTDCDHGFFWESKQGRCEYPFARLVPKNEVELEPVICLNCNSIYKEKPSYCDNYGEMEFNEESQEDLWKLIYAKAEIHNGFYPGSMTDAILNILKSDFTIQRKKS